MKTLSAIIITKNEEKNIKRCLDSLDDFVDEIIVVDSKSTDRTKELCSEYSKVKFYEFPNWPGFGEQKNRALSKASGDWIISVDADEVVTENLKEEILSSLKTEKADCFDFTEAYYLPRLSYVCKIPVKFCGWYPDYVLRLFKKESAYFSSNLVHEHLNLKSSNIRTKRLKNHLVHYSYQSIEDLLSKTNLYSTFSAQEKRAKHKKVSFLLIIFRSVFEFFRSYFLQGGILDGEIGLVVSVMKTEAVYYKYLKLYFLNKQQEIPNKQRKS